METIAKIGWIILGLFMAIMTAKIIINTIRSERSRKRYAPNMKPGDKAYASFDSNGVTGEIAEVGDDYVKIVFTVSKDRVYPKN